MLAGESVTDEARGGGPADRGRRALNRPGRGRLSGQGRARHAVRGHPFSRVTDARTRSVRRDMMADGDHPDRGSRAGRAGRCGRADAARAQGPHRRCGGGTDAGRPVARARRPADDACHPQALGRRRPHAGRGRADPGRGLLATTAASFPLPDRGREDADALHPLPAAGPHRADPDRLAGRTRRGGRVERLARRDRRDPCGRRRSCRRARPSRSMPSSAATACIPASARRSASPGRAKAIPACSRSPTCASRCRSTRTTPRSACAPGDRRRDGGATALLPFGAHEARLIGRRTRPRRRLLEGLSRTSPRSSGRRSSTSPSAAPSAWRRGGSILAGDAAHVHSPVGGRGMNLGIWDAGTIAFLPPRAGRASTRPEGCLGVSPIRRPWTRRTGFDRPRRPTRRRSSDSDAPARPSARDAHPAESRPAALRTRLLALDLPQRRNGLAMEGER